MTVTLGLPLPLPPFFDFIPPRVAGGLIGKGTELLTRAQVIQYWLNVLRVTPGQYWPRLVPQIPKEILGAIGLLLLLPDGLADGTYGPGMELPVVIEPGMEPQNLLPGIQYTFVPDSANPDQWYWFRYTEDLYRKYDSRCYCETDKQFDDVEEDYQYDKPMGGPTKQGVKFRYKATGNDGTFHYFCMKGAYEYTSPKRITHEFTTWDRQGNIYNRTYHSVHDTYTSSYTNGSGNKEVWSNFSNVTAEPVNNGTPSGTIIPLTTTLDPGWAPRPPAPGTRIIPLNPAQAGTAPAPVPIQVPVTGAAPLPGSEPIVQPEPVPIPVPGDFPLPEPGTSPDPDPIPVVPLPAVPLPAVAPGANPAISTPTTPAGDLVAAKAPPIVQTKPGDHYPWPGSGPITTGGVRPTLSNIAAEVGRIESKVNKVGGSVGGLNPLDLIDAINDLQELIEGLQGEAEYPSDTYTLTGVCEELNDDGQQPVFSTPVSGGIWPVAALSRLDAIQYLLQAHLGYKTPTCGSTKPKLEGDWVTVRFESDANSPNGERPLRKLLRYRTKSGEDLGATTRHWSDFTWQAGPVCVIHKGAWWGTPQVWARDRDEGKRVIRHAAREAGIDPDQNGQWSVSGSDNPRYGMPGTMRVAQVGGLDWVTKREGPSALPDLAADP